MGQDQLSWIQHRQSRERSPLDLHYRLQNDTTQIRSGQDIICRLIQRVCRNVHVQLKSSRVLRFFIQRAIRRPCKSNNWGVGGLPPRFSNSVTACLEIKPSLEFQHVKAKRNDELLEFLLIAKRFRKVNSTGPNPDPRFFMVVHEIWDNLPGLKGRRIAH